MTLLIDLLIALIVILVIVASGYHYLPKIEQLLEEKLNISLRRGGKINNAILTKIFYKYNHDSTQDWSKWITTEKDKIKDKAINKLLEHVAGEPHTWGQVTPEAIIALAKFKLQEHVELFKEMMATCKKFWKKYKISEPCYEAALIALILIDEPHARDIFQTEINKKSKYTDMIAGALVNALEFFSDETDVSDLISSFLTNKNISYKNRKQMIFIAKNRNQDDALMAFMKALRTFIGRHDSSLSSEDIQVYDELLESVFDNYNEEVFDLVLSACRNKFLFIPTIKYIERNIKKIYPMLKPEEIFTLMYLPEDAEKIFETTLMRFQKLTADEKSLIDFKDYESLYPFKTITNEVETQTKAMDVPDYLSQVYISLKDALKQRALEKQNGITGGLLITGKAAKEKLYLGRASSSERKWHFIYASLEDVMNSPNDARFLLDIINRSKPCVLYMDKVDILKDNSEKGFVKNLRQLAADPLVFLIGTSKRQAKVGNDSKLLVNISPLVDELFPSVIEIDSFSPSAKDQIIQNKVGLLTEQRDPERYSEFNIAGATKDLTPFEFSNYLTNYFKVALLVFGRLIHVADYDKLSAEFTNMENDN